MRLAGTAVGVRDSKNPDDGTLTVTPRAWRAFLGHAKHGDLDSWC